MLQSYVIKLYIYGGVMDKVKLSDLLGVPQEGIFRVKAIALDSCGSSLSFDCSYEVSNAT
jgi:hypothetical protein